MFGLDVLIWHGQGTQAPSFIKTLKHYLFGGPIGHSAIKLTIPATPEYDALVKQYCQRDGRILIPHFKTDVIVPRSYIHPQTKQVQYYPDKQPGWIIYFSVWPNGLGYEHRDRSKERYDTEVVYENTWQTYLQIQQCHAPGGKVHAWLGRSLSRLIFGPPKRINMPIETIVHPHPNAQEHQKRIQRAKDAYHQYMGEFDTLVSQFKALIVQMHLIKVKLFAEERSSPFFTDETMALHWQNKLAILKQQAKYKEMELAVAERKMSAAKHHLRKIEAHYYAEVATIGANPNANIHIPMLCNGRSILSIEDILAAMRKMLNYDFDIVFNNCSSTVHNVLSAALTKDFCQLAFSQHWLSKSDLCFGLVSTPKAINALAQKIAYSVMQFSFMQINEHLPNSTPPAQLLPTLRTFLPRAAKEKAKPIDKSTPTCRSRACSRDSTVRAILKPRLKQRTSAQ